MRPSDKNTGPGSCAARRRNPRASGVRIAAWPRRLEAAGLGCVALALCLAATPVQAQTEVPTGWSLIPSGVSAGGDFRLLVVTSTRQTAEDTDIADYNTVVQGDVASNGHADIQMHSATFSMLGCSETVSAITNTNTASTDTAAAIYWLNGAKVADDYADLYDGNWDSNVPTHPDGTEVMQRQGLNAQTYVGCTQAGAIHSSNYLGADQVTQGYPGHRNSEMGVFPVRNDVMQRYYGLSAIFRVPANTAASGAPTISGTARVGQTLTAATSGIMDGDGLTRATYTYQWRRVDADSLSNPTDIGTDASTYILVEADEGKKIRVVVSFQDDSSNDEALTSDAYPSGANTVAAAQIANTAASGAPTISGTARVGQTLAAATSGIMDGDGLTRATYTYQWRRVDADGMSNQTDIGTDASTYILVEADEGKKIQVQVSFQDDEGNNEDLTSDAYPSGANTVAAAQIGNTAATGAPTISGTAQVGQTLTAATSGIMDGDGLTGATYTYQWRRVDADGMSNQTDIGTDASTYTLVAADEGKKIRVEVSFQDDSSYDEALTSDAYPSGTNTVAAAQIDNRAPTFTEGDSATRSVAEYTVALTNIGNPVGATDTDTSDELTYELGGTDAASFVIVTSSGQLQTKSGVNYDIAVQSSYAVTVTVTDGRGGTDSIAVTISVTPAEPLPTPTNLRVIQRDLELLVYWDSPRVQRQLLRYELGLRTGSGEWDDSYEVADVPARFGGLMNDTQYTVRVRAVFAVVGTTDWTTSSPVTLVAASQAPGPVTVYEVRARPEGADLRFLPVDHATRYVVQWLTDAQWTAEMMAWTSAEEASRIQIPDGITLAGLMPETLYRARIRAENAVGPGPWTETSFTTGRALPPPPPPPPEDSPIGPPAPPRDLQATGEDRAVSLTWRAPVDDGGARIVRYEYRLRVGDGPEGEWQIIGDGPGAESPVITRRHRISGLTNGTRYTVQVRAVNNDGGASDPSEPASATPMESQPVPAVPPIGLLALAMLLVATRMVAAARKPQAGCQFHSGRE